MTLSRIAILSTWPRALHRGTGIAMALGNLRRALEASGVAVEFPLPAIEEGARMGIERTRRQLEVGAVTPESLPSVSLAIDIDGHHLPGRKAGGDTVKIVHVRTNFVELETICSPDEKENMEMRSQALRENLRTADGLITSSRYTLEHLRHHCPELPDDQLVMPNALDEKLANWLKTNPVPRDPAPLVVGYGSANWRKDFITGLAASLDLTERGLNHRFELLTYGTLLPELRDWVDSHDARHIHIKSTTQDRKSLATLLQRAWVVCHPSIQEDFGNVYLEGPAAGAPVAAVDNHIAQEHALEPRAGRLAQPGDSAGLADAMEDLIRRRQNDAGEFQAPLPTAYSAWRWSDAARSFLTFATNLQR